MVPVLDGAIFPPIGVTAGVYFLHAAKYLGVGTWFYFVFWFVTTFLAYQGIHHAGLVLESRREMAQNNSDDTSQSST